MEKTLSLYQKINGTDFRQTDENGNILNGTRIGEDGKTILRFRDGLLDGDVFNSNGKLIVTKPAVECGGHQEYWRHNKLHRDGGLPAVLSNGLKDKEWWIDGVRQSEEP